MCFLVKVLLRLFDPRNDTAIKRLCINYLHNINKIVIASHCAVVPLHHCTIAPTSYSPLIAVIPGSFFPSIYSSIAPPPVET
jgi:hypothetical protein